jgi:Bifunctional DNA primase/polymerase, N-terminal
MSSWWNSSRAVYGTELRAGALCVVDHGWPVVPGSWWQDGGWHGAAGPDSGPISGPAIPQGVSAASSDPAQVARWWSQAPYAVLLATGGALDVIEMPAWMGHRVARALRSIGVVAPLAAMPTGRWWFPVTTGGPALSERAGQAGVTLHGAGSWVIAPPSECTDGLVHWRVHPSVCGWRLPESQLVHCAAAEAVRWHDDGDRSSAQWPAGVASGARS